MRKLDRSLLAILSTLGILLASTLSASQDTIWSSVSEVQIPSVGERWITPTASTLLALDQGRLDAQLQATPLEGSASTQWTEVILDLPLPNGESVSFRIEESPIMAPELAAKFPELRTYRGQGIDSPATVRFDLTPSGFHAMISSPDGTVFIDPYQRGDSVHHISYYRSSAVATEDARNFRCHTTGSPLPLPLPASESGAATRGAPNLPNGDTLKTYRTVVAATGEYTAFHSAGSPTVPEGMAAIVTAMNRVNSIYERDMAIRMTLVGNNDLVVYTDGTTDPYTNNSGGAMLGQNQITVDAEIGSANYDIGHVFSTGGGGVASLRVPCVNGSKARGVTGLGSPTGDPFWVDYVAHEMGHQWGGNHTFNGSSGSCSGGNRNSTTAYEPGSGTTIMAYAGICSPQNTQSNSDDHFHNASYQEIVNYITTGNGNNCDAPTATGNTPPTPDAGSDYTIPINTPFELCGSATDPDPDTLTYNWEEFDLGPTGHPDAPVGDAAIFRSFSSTLSSCRTFPQPSDLLNNTHTLGELLPSYSRTMTFRMLARDNRANGGGTDYDSAVVTVSDVGGPFLVTAPNSAVTWFAGQSENVTWDVANTDLAPISCSQVDILLSTDGGSTYPTSLTGATSNDGSESVTVPDLPTTQARLQVRCVGNVFFDISDSDFTVEGSEIFADGFESGDTTAWN